MTGGGSGGHTTPLLSLAHALKKRSPGCQLTYIGFKGDNFDHLKQAGQDFDFMSFIQAGKFRRYYGESFLSHLIDIKTLLFNIRDFFRVIGSIFAAYKILRKVKPDLVFSKGGFVAVPVGVAARIRGIPIITHDSDAMPGLANRLLARWTMLHASGMPIENYDYPKDKTVFVGVPISEEYKLVSPKTQKQFKQKLGLPSSSQLLFIGSGGHGSATVNELVLNASRMILSTHLNLYLVHITGPKHLSQVTEAYKSVLNKDLLKRVKVYGYLDNFGHYSAAADLIVGRAGATSLSEFAAQQKACIIIPSPFLANGHQLKNAEQLKRLDAATILSNDASPDEFISVVNELLSDGPRRLELGKNLSRLAVPNSADKLAKLLLNAIDKQETQD